MTRIYRNLNVLSWYTIPGLGFQVERATVEEARPAFWPFWREQVKVRWIGQNKYSTFPRFLDTGDFTPHAVENLMAAAELQKNLPKTP